MLASLFSMLWSNSSSDTSSDSDYSTMLPVLQVEEECQLVHCAILPLGFLLLAMDSIVDIRWVFWPSFQTEAQLRQYYTRLLVPSWQQGHPGYLFPLYAIYRLCFTCPTRYNYMLLALYLPIARRYMGILSKQQQQQQQQEEGGSNTSGGGNHERLEHWWTVLVLRVGLAVVNTWALQQQQHCSFPRDTITFALGRYSYSSS